MDSSVAYRLEALEKFMEVVAQMVGCLPSYCDSHPDRGNAHIIERLRHLASQSSGPTNKLLPSKKAIKKAKARGELSPRKYPDPLGAGESETFYSKSIGG